MSAEPKDQKPDANQFARLVIYHLAHLRVELADLRKRLSDLQGTDPESSRKQNQKLKEEATKLCNAYLKAAQLSPLDTDETLPPSPDPFSNGVDE